MEWIVIAVLIGTALFLVVTFNRLVSLGQKSAQAWADIAVQLKQRHDLVPNLVETVKGYAGHERGTLEAVVNARNVAIAAGATPARVEAENQLSGALRQMFALAESYPDLKANQNFLELQTELADTENKIAAARRFFNNATSEFNAATQQFPAMLFARSFGFVPRPFFELEESERIAVQTAPQVRF